MTFSPKAGSFYRMPIFFGPTPGPRQWPAGKTFDFKRTPKRRVAGVRFLSDAQQLSSLLPDRFELWGEPIVTVELTYFTEIEWLAGRGYNMCDVKFNARYQGKDGPICGTLVLVRWENLCDAILAGREELGHNKLYCEIPPLNVLAGKYSATMSWLSTPFLEFSISGLKETELSVARNPENQGMLSYKYIPRTGQWGEADVEYATLSPAISHTVSVTSRLHGEGQVAFRRVTWEELPTLHHIVNAFSDLRVLSFKGGYLFDAVGGGSIADTHRLY
jgi:hypothetical protein